MFRQLDPSIAVAPQISVSDVADAARAGFALIINNRPEGESADQPSGADIAAAARANGLDYIAIPVGHAGFSHAQIAAMGEALSGASGPVLAYCRSGTRSTFLWSMARAAAGDDPAMLARKAAGAGYDLSPAAAMLDMLAGQAR